MKGKWLGLAFLIPFGFLGLWADWAYNWAWAWVLLGAGAVLLGSCAGRTWAAGNAVSFGVSVLCVELFGLGQYNDYFKPLGAIGVAALFYGVTMGIAWLVRKKEWLILGLLLGAIGLAAGLLYSLQLSL